MHFDKILEMYGNYLKGELILIIHFKESNNDK